MSEEAGNSPGLGPDLMIRHRMSVVVTAHGILFALALFAAFSLAYNFRWMLHRDRWLLDLYLPLLALALPIKLLVFHWTG
ncbi:MAG: hypothetical protein JSU86_08775, partial [Phycisphaerales bacterium]